MVSPAYTVLHVLQFAVVAGDIQLQIPWPLLHSTLRQGATPAAGIPHHSSILQLCSTGILTTFDDNQANYHQ